MKTAKTIQPTTVTYTGLQQAYDHLNAKLFDKQLPPCLITMQRKSKAYGYFAGGRFGARKGGHVTDEIALNPSTFKGRTDEQTLGTLAHEMVHLWQHHFGKPSRAGYHNKEWAEKMKAIGLTPTSTGAPGGKETGQSVTHMIDKGGAYQLAYQALKGFNPLYVEMWSDEEAKKKAKKKAASKTKYTCPDCGANAWAKPATKLICGECEVAMPGEDGDEGDED